MASENSSAPSLGKWSFWRLFATVYRPQPDLRDFVQKAESQENPHAKVTVAIPDARQCEQIFGVPIMRRGLQPVWLRIENRSSTPLRLQLIDVDPNYYTPLEAAAVNHFSMLRRLSAFGLLGWWLFGPLLLVLPSKLITALRANRRMDETFRSLALYCPIDPGSAAEGFVFTTLDLGTKVVRVTLHPTGDASAALRSSPVETAALVQQRLESETKADLAAVQFTFSIPVLGIAADYLRHNFESLAQPEKLEECDVRTLIDRLAQMPLTTTNAGGTRNADPLNLVVIGGFDALLSTFAERWDESETITLATCWKTMRSFLIGSQYRYSPVSALYLFARSQDVALQRSRHSINERLHLRLWLTSLSFHGQPVWLGQCSRDVGVRFTLQTWNLTTHRIDPDVDEARDYVIEDLLKAEHTRAAGYVDAAEPCDAAQPRRNLTGDAYFTDGKRAVILLSAERTRPSFVAWQ